ncbi:pimeloyl-ACP methyl ester carboxylesterase [Streptomyces sp. 3211.6]|uniref:alpha/beta fold hydrolase n=1 Tax=Streptomyces TaxID=1883 RepID=UPI0009A50074|nr:MULTISPECIES: alpha/beta hydrolase [Streptomyces]RKT07060.1 pimeloyl-ACP methyl ester carboxylesterase [Streptomyces sp. 3211.6]RPF45333.1 pimeloyl-ACP methyl ester carboxylesterase [Streptomyces sp. Ag109_G2-6]
MSVITTAPYARTVRKESGGPGLLLAHGGGGAVESNFGAILDELAAGHSVVAVDYPGAGNTPVAEGPLRLDELADQLVAAADAEGLETFAVLGYSLGGNVALRVAARYPERVTALVLTASFVRAGNRLKQVADLWSGLAARGENEMLARLMVPLALNPAVFEGLSPEEAEEVVRATAASVPAGTVGQVDLVKGADLRAEAAGVSVPALVIATTEDRLVPLELQRELAEAVPGARYAELPTGHLPFAERPAEWAALITEFLSELRAG